MCHMHDQFVYHKSNVTISNTLLLKAVGVKVKRWHTMHGVALNVDPPMEYFKHIVPCGIANRPVTCLADFVPGAYICIAGMIIISNSFRYVYMLGHARVSKMRLHSSRETNAV